ncbi:hypothetical protein BKA62DRAFT_696012 [Auriculariales sp. MPI-PUGE-AT-0066]|nr:hypothetical protein BKA62DRAFT_696012 [Auriculariales sp. MPI-PUGE-AT-0066]
MHPQTQESPRRRTAPLNGSPPNQPGPLPCPHQSHTMNQTCEPQLTPSEIGPYVPVNCQKSPCPALNALCNHGAYGMPRDGKNVHAFVLARALIEVYGLSTFFAYTLAVGSILGITKGWSLSLNLKDLCALPIAHFAALVHVNPTQKGKFTDGRPSRFLLNDMFEKAGNPNDPNFNLDNWARWRNIQEYKTVMVNGEMPEIQAGIAAGELALFLQVFGDPARQFSASRAVIDEFFGYEKLPDSWRPQRPPPAHRIGFRSTIHVGGDVREGMAKSACRNHTPPWVYLAFIIAGLGGIGYILHLVSFF